MINKFYFLLFFILVFNSYTSIYSKSLPSKYDLKSPRVFTIDDFESKKTIQPHSSCGHLEILS